MATANDPQPQQGEQKNRRNLIIIIVLGAMVAILGGLLIYQMTQTSEKEDEIAYLSTDNEELQSEIEALDKEIADLESALRDANLDKEEKEKRIKQLLQQVNDLQSRVNQMIRSGKLKDKELEELQQMLKDLEFYNERYKQKIEELEARNQELTRDNEELRGQVDTLAEERQQLEEEVERSQETIEAAARLQTVDFTFTPIKNDKEKSSGPILRKRHLKDKIRVCSVVLSNAAAEAGPRDVYMVIKGPEGQVLQSMETSSGYFTVGGQEQVYTAKQRISYSGSEQTVCVEYLIPEDYDFEYGTYDVVFYINGKEAGSDSFMVKFGL